jgi:methionine--tRNA ligase beta chain
MANQATTIHRVDRVNMITVEEFARLEILIGTVIAAHAIANTDTLLHLEIDLGSDVRHVVTSMAAFFDPSYFLGKQVPVLVNLAPRSIHGIESQGMLLAADDEGRPVLLHPDTSVPDGCRVR